MKPSILKGTRDFGPDDVRKRYYIFNQIREVFELYGYQPIETPAMEKLTTLTGKYGEEGDQLVFKLLNNGDFLSNVDDAILKDKNSNAAVPQLSKRGLRYDLTVPFARYVVMNQHAIQFPFKRYQIQPVWRADRPQKGRFQEFYQCDADIVGSNALIYEAELIQIYDQVFTRLNLEVEILMNNRKVLEGIAEVAGIKDLFVPMVNALDKLDKIGEEKVIIEMTKSNISEKAAKDILNWVTHQTVEELSETLSNSSIALEGIREIQEVETFLKQYTFGKGELKIDFTLARGLSYYTGCVFEVKAKNAQMGSIGGGGRYDNLTSIFGLKDVSGVGISFGAERIFLVLDELDLFPKEISKTLDLFLIALDEESHTYAYSLLISLRQHGIKCDLYPDASKMKKMMKYANSIEAPYIVVIGETERETGNLKLKNMNSGEEINLKDSELIPYFQ